MHIADAKLQLGQIALAKALYVKVMAVLDARPVLSAEHLAVALNNRAQLHRTLGDLPAAEADLARAAQILGKVFGLGHPTLGLAAINIAELRMERGDLALAEEALRQAIAVSAAALGKGHPQVGYGALLLANLYRTRGEHARAKSLYDEVLALLESAHGADHPTLAEALNHAGVQALGAGDTSRAHQLLDRAWKILMRPENLSHTLRPTLAQNLAIVVERGGDSEGAQRLLDQAIVACDRQAGVEMECASPRYNLGLLHLRARRLAQAQVLLQAALAVRVKHGGPGHPEVARSLGALASLLDLQGKTAKAAVLLEQATAIRERQLALALAGGADGPKRALVATLAEERDWVLDVLLRAGRHGAAWELIVQRKGRALEAMVDGMRGTGADPQLRLELAAARARLAAVYARGAAGQPQELYAAALRVAVTASEETERKAVARIGGSAASATVRATDAQTLLPERGALLEFVVRKPLSLRDPKSADSAAVISGCLLLRKGAPVCRDLGKAETIEALAVALRRAAMTPGGDVDAVGGQLRKLIVDPFAAQLQAIEHLIVAADGALHLTPFAALPTDRGQRLLHKYAVSYLTSGRDLLRMTVQTKPRGPAVMMGDPAYDDLGRAPPENASAAPRSDVVLGKFAPLPGTAQETKELASLWPNAQVLTGAQATVGALKAVQGPVLLHVATHGFFLADQQDPTVTGARSGRRSAELFGDLPAAALPQLGKDDPLLRSGLALAGANRQPDGRGVVTALEVAGLDLAGTQLAVLSACETGVGDVHNGEGVFGLRRALVLAGAQTQVMSLWKVDDAATRDLMVAMHKALLGAEGHAPLSRVQALRQAQVALSADAKQAHPFYWAAFVLAGDWRILSR